MVSTVSPAAGPFVGAMLEIVGARNRIVNEFQRKLRVLTSNMEGQVIGHLTTYNNHNCIITSICSGTLGAYTLRAIRPFGRCACLTY